LLNIEYSVTKTGKICPIGIIEPTLLSGSLIKKATLHNFDYIMRNNIKINDLVKIEKSGEVIPKITSLNNNNNNTNNKKKNNKNINYDFNFSNICPCERKSILIKKDNELYCTDNNCCIKLSSKITFFLNSLNFKGISKKTIDLFIENDIIKNFNDIFHIKEKKELILKINGMGVKKFDIIIQNFEKKNFNEANILVGLGIKGLTIDVSNFILKNFDVKKINNYNLNDFVNGGLTKSLSNNLFVYFNNNFNFEEFMLLLTSYNKLII
jgi:DNA ligase (NAD+)